MHDANLSGRNNPSDENKPQQHRKLNFKYKDQFQAKEQVIKHYNFDDIDVISEEKSEIPTRNKETEHQKRRVEFRNFRARLHKNTSEHKLKHFQTEPAKRTVEPPPRVISPLNLMDILDDDVPAHPNPVHKMV